MRSNERKAALFVFVPRLTPCLKMLMPSMTPTMRSSTNQLRKNLPKLKSSLKKLITFLAKQCAQTKCNLCFRNLKSSISTCQTRPSSSDNKPVNLSKRTNTYSESMAPFGLSSSRSSDRIMCSSSKKQSKTTLKYRRLSPDP